MANNRMWLINDRLKRRVLLAKYSPSMGWVSTRGIEQNLDNILDEELKDDNADLISFGPMDWRVVYEMSDNTDESWKEYRVYVTGEPKL